jgi:hypothetical protein
MREFRTYGSVRGALSNERPYRDSRPLFADMPQPRAGGTPAVPARALTAFPSFAALRRGRPGANRRGNKTCGRLDRR